MDNLKQELLNKYLSLIKPIQNINYFNIENKIQNKNTCKHLIYSQHFVDTNVSNSDKLYKLLLN
jgi:hypothetical protein